MLKILPEEIKLERGARILQLMHELREMPEYRLYLELQSLSNSIYILDANFAQLRDLLNFLANDPRADSLFWMQNRDKLQRIGMEIIRLIHNFVAAALSLIDHTRRIYKNYYKGRNLFPDYEERKNSEFAQDPLAKFVYDLRRYCQHYKSPEISFVTYSPSPAEGFVRIIELPIEELKAFDEWSSLARKYLDALGKDVNVLEVAMIYREKVIRFYEWFQSRQDEIHSVEIKRFKNKEAELLLLELEDKIDLCFANRKYLQDTGEGIFLHTFASREYSELEKLARDSQERPTRAIQLLEQNFPIAEELKHKIFQLYKDPDFFASARQRDEAS